MFSEIEKKYVLLQNPENILFLFNKYRESVYLCSVAHVLKFHSFYTSKNDNINQKSVMFYPFVTMDLMLFSRVHLSISHYFPNTLHTKRWVFRIWNSNYLSTWVDLVNKKIVQYHKYFMYWLFFPLFIYNTLAIIVNNDHWIILIFPSLLKSIQIDIV